MKKTAILLAALLMSSTAAYSGTWAPYSNLLSMEMTEQQVIQAIGYRQTSTEIVTCGSTTPEGGWLCKIFRFGSLRGSDDCLVVYFHQLPDDSWLVNNWEVLE